MLTAPVSTVVPEINAAQAKGMYQVIGTMTTKTTSNKDRNTNIQIAANALDGLIVQPGEEFSFNKTTGNRTLEKGYKPVELMSMEFWWKNREVVSVRCLPHFTMQLYFLDCRLQNAMHTVMSRLISHLGKTPWSVMMVMQDRI